MLHYLGQQRQCPLLKIVLSYIQCNIDLLEHRQEDNPSLPLFTSMGALGTSNNRLSPPRLSQDNKECTGGRILPLPYSSRRLQHRGRTRHVLLSAPRTLGRTQNYFRDCNDFTGLAQGNRFRPIF